MPLNKLNVSEKHTPEHIQHWCLGIAIGAAVDGGELLVQPIQHRDPYRFLCREMAEYGWLANSDGVRNQLGRDGIGAVRGNEIEHRFDDLLLARIGRQSVLHFGPNDAQ